jgi:FtsP/CotA-like multicopper oxidase with cupredoxin domain
MAVNLFLVSQITYRRLYSEAHALHASADSALIYFAQNGSYLGPISGTNPSSVTSQVGFNENATLPFEPGKTYRLRIINTSAFAMFYFWIDGHDMRIIEADGVSLFFYINVSGSKPVYV